MKMCIENLHTMNIMFFLRENLKMRMKNVNFQHKARKNLSQCYYDSVYNLLKFLSAESYDSGVKSQGFCTKELHHEKFSVFAMKNWGFRMFEKCHKNLRVFFDCCQARYHLLINIYNTSKNDRDFSRDSVYSTKFGIINENLEIITSL